jgi:HPt (histidine-containing phosphotransfer) domain-containing protein
MARRRERFASIPRLPRIPGMSHLSRPEADAPSTDQESLDRLRRFGGEKLVREMIALFLAAMPERVQTARDAARRGDGPVAERALHALKSSAAQLGAMRMQRLSEQGEHAARDGSMDAVRSIVEELADEQARVHAWLSAACDGSAA